MKKWILILVLLGAFVTMGGGMLVWLATKNVIEVENGSVLVLDLQAGVQENETEAPLPFLGDDALALRQILQALRRAAHDQRIEGVLLRLGGTGINLAQLQELREAVEIFRESGKAIVAFGEDFGNGTYYLASSCDRIALVPVGAIDLRGLAVNAMFLRGSLEKLGVEAEFEHVGKYKSAAEIFTEDRMSEAARESIGALLDDIYAQLLEGIGAGRDLSPEQVAEWVDLGPWKATDALEAGMVDVLAYSDEWSQLFAFFADIPEVELPLISVEDYAMAEDAVEVEVADATIALVYGLGSIHSGESDDGTFGRAETIGSATMAEAIRSARLDEDVDALVIRVDSPGGSALASDVIWREVDLAAARMPVVVSMGGVAASGGYYISVAADEIFVNPGTVTGSIGVVGGKFNLGGLYEKLGVTHDTMRRGAHADLWSDHRAWTAEERALVLRMMEVVYESFVGKVVVGRELELASVLEVAQGRIWSGVAAVELGLADHVGGLSAAIRRAKELIDVDPEQLVHLRLLPEEKPFLERLLSGELFGAYQRTVAPPDLSFLLGDAALLSHRRLFATTAPGDPLALMPYELEIDH